MNHFTWTWIISRFDRAWLYKDQKIWNFQHACLAQLDRHQTYKSVMVSVVSSSQTRGNFNFLRHLNANFVQKWQECQICVIYENLECWRAQSIPDICTIKTEWRLPWCVPDHQHWRWCSVWMSLKGSFRLERKRVFSLIFVAGAVALM